VGFKWSEYDAREYANDWICSQRDHVLAGGRGRCEQATQLCDAPAQKGYSGIVHELSVAFRFRRMRGYYIMNGFLPSIATIHLCK
jgi:hypothetical protein